MFIMFGWGYRTIKKYGSIDNQACYNCHNTVDREIVKVVTWFTLFFIPVIPYRVEYLIVCPICKDAFKISKVDFEQMIEGNSINLQSGSIIGKSSFGSDTKEKQDEIYEKNKYAGKTETQIAYLKQMEELKNRQEQLDK